MSIFSGKRLETHRLRLDREGLRRGYYSDKYFENVSRVLTLTDDPAGSARIEAQYFSRHQPHTLTAGVDVALAMLRHATGYYEGEQFIETWEDLEILAVEDGTLTRYYGDPLNVLPVMKVRGRYRDFARLETAMLGVMAHATRIATNVYDLLAVANGKQVLYFPARFDLYEAQAIGGYAYWLGVQRHNHDTGQSLIPAISTDAQGAWWDGVGGGTIPHAMIACFSGDTVRAMEEYARHLPVEVKRIVLADFHNHTVRESLATLDAFWARYREAWRAGDTVEQARWTLAGVRLDTSSNMVDESLPVGAEGGVSPLLVRTVRSALNSRHEHWHETGALAQVAQDYCQAVQIVVTGGFNRQRIAFFESEGVPVDVYGVGSSFLVNDRTTNTDYSMDVVRKQVNGEWVHVAKKGRRACDNPDLQPVDLSVF